MPVRNLRMLPSEPEQLQLWAESMLDGGLFTEIDPVDIANKNLTAATNVLSRESRTYTRYGTNLLTPTKPNTDKVHRFVRYREFDGTERYVRFAGNKVHLRGASSWTEITGAGYNSVANPNIQIITANNRFFFSAGQGQIQEIDFTVPDYDDLGNSKPYKYYIPFYNRIVGANLNDPLNPNPIEVGWSGDLNFGEWDPIVDLTAGFGPLIDNPADSSDFISGLQVVADVGLVIREYSIWTATRVPSATTPFYFANTVPNYGCNIPSSIVRIPNGIAYYDERLNNVFALIAGSREPEAIGLPVRSDIRSALENKDSVRGFYNPVLNQYGLVIPNATTGITRIYLYDFGYKSWQTAEYANVVQVENAEFSSTSFTIDDLQGTIDQLQGTIDDLSITTLRTATFFTRNDGSILIEDATSTTDAGGAVNYEIRSKLFKLPAIDAYVAQLHIEYKPITAGSFTIEYSKDGGETFTPYKTVSFGGLDVGKRLTVVCNKNIRARTFMWRIVATNSQFEVIEYSTFVYAPAGFTRQKLG